MSDLSKKAIEAGVIPQQAIKMLKFWRSLPDDMPDTEKQALTEAELLTHLKEMEALLDGENVLPELRETDLGLSKLYMENRKLCNIQVTTKLSLSLYAAYVAKYSSVVFAVSDLQDIDVDIVTAIGNVVHVDGAQFVIEDTERRFLGERLEYLVCKVRSV